MKLTSSAFKEGEKIPMKFTCEGKNINPELHITAIPENAQSLVLIVDDPDVPEFVRKDRMYDHWVLYDIPSSTSLIPEHVLSLGTQGKNTGGGLGYTGPCPPDREHRYFFKLYALSKKLQLPPGATKKEVEQKMQGHILAQAQLMGLYEKHQK